MNPDYINLSDTDLLSAAVGIFLPPVVAVVQQPHWAKLTRALVTAGICIAVGTLLAYSRGVFSVHGVLRCFILVMILAYTTYREFWKPTGAASAIETNTLIGIGEGATKLSQFPPLPLSDPAPETSTKPNQGEENNVHSSDDTTTGEAE